jgi:hypothetical protein
MNEARESSHETRIQEVIALLIPASDGDSRCPARRGEGRGRNLTEESRGVGEGERKGDSWSCRKGITTVKSERWRNNNGLFERYSKIGVGCGSMSAVLIGRDRA